jgi:hypothetical protein
MVSIVGKACQENHLLSSASLHSTHAFQDKSPRMALPPETRKTRVRAHRRYMASSVGTANRTSSCHERSASDAGPERGNRRKGKLGLDDECRRMKNRTKGKTRKKGSTELLCDGYERGGGLHPGRGRCSGNRIGSRISYYDGCDL